MSPLKIPYDDVQDQGLNKQIAVALFQETRCCKFRLSMCGLTRELYGRTIREVKGAGEGVGEKDKKKYLHEKL